MKNAQYMMLKEGQTFDLSASDNMDKVLGQPRLT